MRKNNHLIDLGAAKKNQIIAAQLSKQGSLLSTDIEPLTTYSSTAQERLNQALHNTSAPSAHYQSNATILTFVEGVLVGENYGTYDADSEGINNVVDHHNNTVFHGVDAEQIVGVVHQNIPSLTRVAQKVS